MLHWTGYIQGHVSFTAQNVNRFLVDNQTLGVRISEHDLFFNPFSSIQSPPPWWFQIMMFLASCVLTDGKVIQPSDRELYLRTSTHWDPDLWMCCKPVHAIRPLMSLAVGQRGDSYFLICPSCSESQGARTLFELRCLQAVRDPSREGSDRACFRVSVKHQDEKITQTTLYLNVQPMHIQASMTAW